MAKRPQGRNRGESRAIGDSSNAVKPDPDSCRIKTELALRRFDVVSKLVVYEGTLYWSRAQLFLVANAALVGFTFRETPSDLTGVTYTRLAILLV